MHHSLELEEPLLPDVPFPGEFAAAWRNPALEPIPFWRPSECRRPRNRCCSRQACSCWRLSRRMPRWRPSTAGSCCVCCRRSRHDGAGPPARLGSVASILTAIIYMLGGSAASRLRRPGHDHCPYAYFRWRSGPSTSSWSGAGFRAGRYSSACWPGPDGTRARSGGVASSARFWSFRLVFLAFRSGAPLNFLRARAGVLAVAALTGASILLVPSLLTMQFLGTSNRPGIPYGVAAAGLAGAGRIS